MRLPYENKFNIISKPLLILWGCFFIFSSSLCFAQENSNKEPFYIRNTNAEKIAVDPLGNIYSFQESSISKYNIEGRLLYTYSNFSDGTISSMDVSNPMKIMLFYKESATIILLDDRLVPISEKLNLADKGLSTISLAAFSSTNQIWLYDFVNMDLLSLDLFLNPIHKIHYNFPNFDPVALMEISGKMFILHNPETGIYFFDSFGSYIKSIAILTDNEIQFIHNSVLYIKDDQLCIYNYVELSEEVIPLPISDARQCLQYRNKLILLNKKGDILIY